MRGILVDMGPSDFANGVVGYDAGGEIQTYTVASGDSLMAIGARFCIDWVNVMQYNNETISVQPGDVLMLRPGPGVGPAR